MGAHVAAATKATFDKTIDGNEQPGQMRAVRETATRAVRNGIEAASKQARTAADQFSEKLGFTAPDTERLAQQSKDNLEAVISCGTVLSQAYREASRRLFDLGQRQYQRNLDGMTKLAEAKSPQEFTALATFSSESTNDTSGRRRSISFLTIRARPVRSSAGSTPSS